VAYRSVPTQRPCSKQIYDSHYCVTDSQTNTIPRQQLDYMNEESCVLRCTCRDVVSRTSLEVTQSQSEK
jgi:hypothetical protein